MRKIEAVQTLGSEYLLSFGMQVPSKGRGPQLPLSLHI